MAPVFRYLFLYFSLLCTSVFAQDVSQLLQSAQKLSADKNYAAAITEYKKALNIDSNSATGNYGLALALYAAARPAEGVPYLQTALKNTTGMPFTAACYSLLGSIYTANKQLPKAVEAYKSAIEADSTNQRIYYNLGIAYFMGKQYNSAEKSFIDAINRDSSDAGSVRMYALSTFHQNKRAEALLGFCRFLQLEPGTLRSKDALSNMQAILNGGSLKAEAGYKSTASKVYNDYYNGVLARSQKDITARRYASPAALLTALLRSAFKALGTLPRDKQYWWFGYADYYYSLSQSDKFDEFIKTISQSNIKDRE